MNADFLYGLFLKKPVAGRLEVADVPLLRERFVAFNRGQTTILSRREMVVCPRLRERAPDGRWNLTSMYAEPE